MGHEPQAVRLRQHRFIKDRGSPAVTQISMPRTAAPSSSCVLAAQRVPVYRADVLQRSHGVGVKRS